MKPVNFEYKWLRNMGRYGLYRDGILIETFNSLTVLIDVALWAVRRGYPMYIDGVPAGIWVEIMMAEVGDSPIRHEFGGL